MRGPDKKPRFRGSGISTKNTTKILNPQEIFDLIKSQCTIMDNDCWIFNGSLYTNGYGRICVNYRRFSTHIFMWEFINGKKIKIDLHHLDICHGNKRCCNPAHLENITRSQHLKLHNGNKISPWLEN